VKISGVDLGVRKAAVATLLVDAQGEHHLHALASYYAHPTIRGKELTTLMEMVGRHIHDSNYVFVEEALVGRGIKTSLQISQTVGAILAESASRGVHSEPVNVSSWKKAVVGSGNASKDTIRLWLNSHHEPYAAACGNDQDQFDAVCIALFGASTISSYDHTRAHGLAEEAGGPDIPGFMADPGRIPEW
jgi:Holliday junction resolvasome RuvABC endonuclease subunit